jgi:hypothetical protein
MRTGNLKTFFQEINSNYAVFKGGVRFYPLSTAVTGNVTVTAAPNGSFAATSNATGRNKIFYSDGSKWQEISGGGSSLALETPTGTVNGTNDEFTFTGTPILVIRNQAIEYEDVHYAADGSTITFITPPTIGDTIRGLV